MSLNLKGKQVKEFLNTFNELMTPANLIENESLAKLHLFRKRMIEALQSGKTPKEAMGLTDDIVESIYAHALENYTSGHIEKALIYLRTLTLIDPENPKYSLALGMVLQLRKSYPQAIFSYTLSTCQDSSNPIPWFHMGDCYHQLGLNDKAISSLEKAIEIAGDQKQYEKLINQSELLLNKYKS